MDLSSIPLIPIIIAAVVLFLLLIGIIVVVVVVKKGKSKSASTSMSGAGAQLSSPPQAMQYGATGGVGASDPRPQTEPVSSWGGQDSQPPAAAAQWTQPESLNAPPSWEPPTMAPPPPPPPPPPPMSVADTVDGNDPYATVAHVGGALPGPDLFMTTPNAPQALPSDAPAGHLRADDGTLVQLNRPVIRMGRHPECEIVIPTPGASRQHAEIEFREGHWVVTDLNSGNGTFVNGVRVKSQPLTPGDEVRVDQTRFTFNVGS